MERPGVRVHLWILLLIQATLWVSSVSATTSSTTTMNSTTTKSTSEPAATVLTTTVTGSPASTSSTPTESPTATESITSAPTTIVPASEPTTEPTTVPTTTVPTTTPVPAGPGESCNESQLCVDNAFCDSTLLCQCNDTYYPSSSNCKERVPLQGQCTGTIGTQGDCVSGAVCDTGNICRTPLDGQCNATAGDQGDCVNGTVCDSDNTCSVAPGGTCTAGTSNPCVLNAACSGSPSTCQCDSSHYASGNQCLQRIPLQGQCTGPNGTQGNCVSGAVCDTGNICRTPLDGQCTATAGDQGDCVSGTVCDSDNTCSVAPGGTCTAGTSNPCVLNAACSGSPSTCQCDSSHYASGNQCLQRIPLQGQCTGPIGTQGNCVSGAVCDTGNICRTPLDGQCTATAGDQGDCVSGTVCDSDNTCRIYAGSNTACDNDSSKCVTTALCDSQTNTCKTRLNQNCSSSPTNCQTNTECVTVSQGKECRKVYGTSCAKSSECQTGQNQACVDPTDASSETLCLCSENAFKDTTNLATNTCRAASDLKVSSLTMNGGDYQEKSIKVKWTPSAAASSGSQAEYWATISTGVSSNGSSNQYASFTSLIEGTEYTVNVTTAKLRNPSYSQADYVEFTSPSELFYTKPAAPGPLKDSVSQGSIVYPGPDVTLVFTTSGGRVQTYTVTLTTSGVSQTVPAAQPGDQTVMFANLTEGNTYQVTIIATITRTDNSQNINSNVYSGTFRVKPNSSGPVSQLTSASNGSRWAEVSWERPLQPKGQMTGYVLVALMMPSQKCVSAVKWVCSDCNISVVAEQTQKVTDQNCTNVVTKTANDATLNPPAGSTPSPVFTTNVTGLLPDVNYTLQVYPYNEAGVGVVANEPHTTNQERAEPLAGMNVDNSQERELRVSWTPGVRTGPTNYTVTWAEETRIGSGTYSGTTATYTVSGYDNQHHAITGLLSYWRYNVTVQVSAALGPPESEQRIAQTASSEPDTVQSFNISQPSDTAQRLELKVICPEERRRNGHITNFTYTSTVEGDVPGPSGDISVSSACTGNGDVIVNAEKNYTFALRAVTSDGKMGAETTRTHRVEARPPKLQNPPDGFGAQFVAAGQTTETSVTVDVCPCVVSTDQGRIVMAGFTVCVESSEDQCRPDLRANIRKSEYEGLKTWKQFKNDGYTGRYRPTPDDWHETIDAGPSRRRRSVLRRVARAVENGVQYTIGANTTCDQYPETVFCNGQLPEGTNFIIIVWACTNGGCSESPDVISVQTKSPDAVSIGAIVGGIVAALAVIAIVVVVVIVYRRRRSREEEDPDGSMNPTTVSLKPVRKPIRLRDFATHLDCLHRDSNLLFQEEFEDVLENSPKHYTQEASTMDANKVKNRYVNILPYDHTRVKLSTDDDDETSDFINANYIPGYTSPREYIATQGPMTGTVADFWRMMWEQKSTLIVMLSDLSEKGRPKVDLYWPTELNSPVQYGDIVVELTSDSTLNKYTIRTFNICLENQPEDRRRVVQYFIPGWEDYSANLNPDDVLDFISTVRQEARSSQGPVTVHCSAGVGRTGTFIALDFLMQFVNDHSLDDEVDIYNLVLNMRHNRPHMVQSEKQYVFIHDTLKLIIEKKIKEMQAHNDENIYQNTGGPEENVYANEAFQPEENLYENTSFKPTTSL